MWDNVSLRVRNLKPSAIRKYFAVPKDVVTLGIGEPDFTSPDKLMAAAAEAVKAEMPKVEKPEAEEPKAEKPKAEKPKAAKPKAEKPKDK